MKKKIAVISMTLIVGVLLYFTGVSNTKAYYYGPPLGATNSPYDGASCAYSGCHSTHPLQSPMPWITSNIPAIGYYPDSTYTFTVKAVYIGKSSFGFQFSPQTPEGKPEGTLIVTNATTTQIGTYNHIQYIEQTQYGYNHTDSLSWSFKWKAPNGWTTMTFYACFNCGQGNTSSANTYVYPATLVVPENPAAINNIKAMAINFSIYPNPARGQVNIAYNLPQTMPVAINMYALDGKKTADIYNSEATEGSHTQSFMLPATISKGIYFIQFIANGQATEQKIVVE